MKEFYFKEKNGETYFFFRNKENSKITYEEWKKKCDEIIFEENNTLDNLLEFLHLNNHNKSEINIENLNVTIWKNEQYKLIKVTFKGESKAITGSGIVYELKKIEERERGGINEK